MTHRDPDNGLVRNPNDPWRREWGTGSVITTIIAIVIMAGWPVPGFVDTILS